MAVHTRKHGDRLSGPNLNLTMYDIADLHYNSHVTWSNIMKRIMEIRSAEGGDDAKLFAKELAAAYTKFFGRVG